MATKSITLDDIWNAMSSAKVEYEKHDLLPQLPGNISQTVTLNRPITDFDFISIEAGDDVNNNPDNSLKLLLVNSITYNRAYMDSTFENNGATPGNGANINFDSGFIYYMFVDATTFKIIYQYNHYLKRLYGWKSKIKWGGGYCRLLKDYITSVFTRGCLLWHKLV